MSNESPLSTQNYQFIAPGFSNIVSWSIFNMRVFHTLDNVILSWQFNSVSRFVIC